jgi:hypothetical protein
MPHDEPPREEKAAKKKILTPEEWAEQQLKHAPPRSEEWAKEVARIWCLDISHSAEKDT